jgi:hypothetical protein
MKKKRFFLYFLVIFFIILISLSLAAYFLLPTIIANKITAGLEKALNRQVKIASVGLSPTRGLTLKKLEIADLQKTGAVFQIEELDLFLNALSLFQKENIPFKLYLDLDPAKWPKVSAEGNYQTQQKLLVLDFKLRDFPERQTAWENLEGKLNLQLSPLPQDKTRSALFKRFGAGFDNFSLDLEVKSKDIQTKVVIKKENENLEISPCKINCFASSLDLVLLMKDLKNPQIDLNADCVLRLLDLEKLAWLPKIKENLEKNKPIGILKAKFNFQSSGTALANWKSSGQITADEVAALGFRASNFNLTWQKSGQTLEAPLSFNFYDGLWKSKLDLAFGENNVPANFTSQTSVSEVNLNKFAQDTNWKNKDVAGLANLQLNLNGQWLKPATFTGDGSINVREGKLWKQPMLLDLAQTIHVSPPTFKEGNATFKIADQYISTEDFTLRGEEMVLTAKGGVHFNKDLAADININFAQTFLNSLGGIGKITGLMVDEAGNLLMQIKLKGTLDKAHFSVKPLATPEVITNKLEEIKNIFEGFFKKKD